MKLLDALDRGPPNSEMRWEWNHRTTHDGTVEVSTMIPGTKNCSLFSVNRCTHPRRLTTKYDADADAIRLSDGNKATANRPVLGMQTHGVALGR